MDEEQDRFSRSRPTASETPDESYDEGAGDKITAADAAPETSGEPPAFAPENAGDAGSPPRHLPADMPSDAPSDPALDEDAERSEPE